VLLIFHISSLVFVVFSVLAAVCSRSAWREGYVVDGGVLDDLMVGEAHDASGLVSLRGAALDCHPRERGVLPVVFGTARLRGHLVGVF